MGQKKFKEHLKARQESLPATLPRKAPSRATFESDFAPSEGESPVPARQGKRFTFDNDFEPHPTKPYEKAREEVPQKSLFEDDFIQAERPVHESSISSIKEEGAEEDKMGKLEKRLSQKRGFGKSRFSNADVNLKKSESVNIFTRENDPFDDDFFSEGACGEFQGLEFGKSMLRGSGKGSREHKWSENFEEFGDDERI